MPYRRTLVLALTAAIAGCSVTVEQGNSGGQRAGDDEAWRTVPARADTEDGIRVLVLHDMEGLSGQDDPRTFRFSHPEYYARGQEMLIGDINAEGLIECTPTRNGVDL